jgi:hypothetical protein
MPFTCHIHIRSVAQPSRKSVGYGQVVAIQIREFIMVRDQTTHRLRRQGKPIRSLYEQKARLQRAVYRLSESHRPVPSLQPGFIENQQLTLPLLKLLPFVRTRHIRLRLSYGKGNSTLQGCNVEPSRCHNEGMKARAYRNKSESK